MIIEMALERLELNPRELAVTFTDEHQHFVSATSVERLLSAQDLITLTTYGVVKTAPVPPRTIANVRPGAETPG